MCVFIFHFLFIAIAVARRFEYHVDGDVAAAVVGEKTLPLNIVDEFVAIQHTSYRWHAIVYNI